MTAQLAKTTAEFIDSLLGSKNRHTLCLNIAEPSFQAEEVVKKHLEGKQKVTHAHEPAAPELEKLLGDLAGKVTLVTYDDLDHHPKAIAVLLAHVKQPAPGGKLIVVSRAWNSDNTERERELRKNCLFFQQSLPKPPKQ